VDYEIKRGLLIKPSAEKEQVYNIIYNHCILGMVCAQVWRCATQIYAGLYAKHLTVSDADILIAAFCIENNCTLVTNNTKDFENIERLNLVDWVEA